MSSPVQMAALAYLAARKAHADAAGAVSEAVGKLWEAEAELQKAVMESDDEDDGTAVVCGSVVITFPEEYWDKPKVQQLDVHKLASGGAA